MIPPQPAAQGEGNKSVAQSGGAGLQNGDDLVDVIVDYTGRGTLCPNGAESGIAADTMFWTEYIRRDNLCNSGANIDKSRDRF